MLALFDWEESGFVVSFGFQVDQSKHLNTTYFGQSYQGGFHIRDVDAAGCHCMNLYNIDSVIEGIGAYPNDIDIADCDVPFKLAL